MFYEFEMRHLEAAGKQRSRATGYETTLRCRCRQSGAYALGISDRL